MENFNEALQWCQDINGCSLLSGTNWVDIFVPIVPGISSAVAVPLNGWIEFSKFLNVWSCTTPSDQVRAGVGRMVSELFYVYGYDSEENRPITTKEALRENITALIRAVLGDRKNISKKKEEFRGYCAGSIYITLVNVITDLCDVASLNGFSFYDVFENRGFDPALLHSVLGTTPAQIGQPTVATGQSTAEQTVTATASTKRGPRNAYTERVRTHIVYELMKRAGMIDQQILDNTQIATFIRAVIGGNPDVEIRGTNCYRYINERLPRKDEATISALFEPFDKKQTRDK